MVEKTLVDALKFKTKTLAEIWVAQVRKSTQLRHYNTLVDEQLIDMNVAFYQHLARTLDRGMDKASMGSFFVTLGKERMKTEFPISEVLFAVSLSQKVLHQFITTECVTDSSLEMYSVVDSVTKISEYYLLGSFYLTKGFLEATYVNMKVKDSVSEELLKRYLRDDFFFK